MKNRLRLKYMFIMNKVTDGEGKGLDFGSNEALVPYNINLYFWYET